mmetsp:Transcript_102428/g.330433  ORF Transcript_102428/g.330433 Transcript_102428/m.330433 type:complete len:244 (-) Transcript_102428:323-1054(-)
MAPSATRAAHFGFRMAMGSLVEPPPTCRGSHVSSSSPSFKSSATSLAWPAAFSPQLPRQRAAEALTAGVLCFRSSLSLEAEPITSSGMPASRDRASERVCMSGSAMQLETISATCGLQASSPMAARAVTAAQRVPLPLSFAATSEAMLVPAFPRPLRARQAAPCTSGDSSFRSPVMSVVWSWAPIMPSACTATTLACSSAGFVSAMALASAPLYLAPSSPNAPRAAAAAMRTLTLGFPRKATR